MPTNRLLEKEKIATYASVLFDGANAQSGQETVMAVRDEAEQIVRATRENASIIVTLSDCTYAPEVRASLAREAFAQCNPVLTDMLTVMAERGDIGLLGRVYNAYGEEIESKLNVTIVDVTTAVELDDHLREVITKKVADDLNTNVVLREHIDTSILGGILMSAQGKRIDASIASQVEIARTTLKQHVDGGEC